MIITGTNATLSANGSPPTPIAGWSIGGAMTEEQWLASTNPAAMLEWLQASATADRYRHTPGPHHEAASERKLRLFTVAALRRVANRGGPESVAQSVALGRLEQFADDGDESFLYEAWKDHPLPRPGIALATNAAARMHARMACEYPMPDQRAFAADALRDIVGNPFRPLAPLRGWERSECKVCSATPNEEGEITHGKGCYVLDADGGGSEWAEPIVTPWVTPDVLALAEAAYREPRERCPCHYAGRYGEDCQRCHGTGNIGTLDPARLAVLSDALEEAGCAVPRRPLRVVVYDRSGAHRWEVVGRDRGEDVVRHEERTLAGARRWADVHLAAKGWYHFSGAGVTTSMTPRASSPRWMADGLTPAETHPLLAHLREPGPHYRGCHALDVVLGKG